VDGFFSRFGSAEIKLLDAQRLSASSRVLSGTTGGEATGFDGQQIGAWVFLLTEPRVG